MKSYLSIAKIKEENKTEFTALEVIKNTLKDFTYLAKEFKKTSKLSENEADLTTQALADGNVAWLEKAIWMLNASK